MRPEIEQLYEELRRDFPLAKPTLETFPSGSVFLDIQGPDDVYVLEYVPGFGVLGVSRQSAAVYGNDGVEQSFESVAAAREYVLKLLGPSHQSGARERIDLTGGGIAFAADPSIGLASASGHTVEKLTKIILESSGDGQRSIELTLPAAAARKLAALLEDLATEAGGE